MHNRLAILLLCLLMSGCAGKLSAPTERAPAAQTSLSQMNEDFLFLSAQDAIRQGQIGLAIQFLSALVSKNPDASVPRLQLAELLLRSNRAEQALKHIEVVIGKRKANAKLSETETDAYVLYARALAMTKRHEKALDILSEVLNRQPGLLNARVLHISILASMNRLDEAHFSILQGLKQEKTPQLYKIEADLYIRQNKLDKAAVSLNRMRKLNPDDETPSLLLAQIAQRQKNNAKAETILRDFLDGHPESLLVRNALGRLLVQTGRMAEAIAIYKSIVRDTGGTSESHATLGLLYFQNEKYEEAAGEFAKALKVSDDDQSRFYLAASLEALEKRDEAKAEYLKISKQSSLYLDAQLRLAGMELGEEKIAAAKKRTRAMIADFPTAERPYMLLSAIYLVDEKYRELIDETEPAMSLPNISSRLLFNRAVAFEHFKQYDHVESSLKLALKLDPKHSEALNFLGYIYAEQGIKLDEAEQLIGKALKLKPEDGYYLDSLAWVYFKRGDFKRAISTQKLAIKQIPDDPVMQEHMGDMLWKHGDHPAARSNWEKAIELKHDHPDLIRKKIAEGLPQE